MFSCAVSHAIDRCVVGPETVLAICVPWFRALSPPQADTFLATFGTAES